MAGAKQCDSCKKFIFPEGCNVISFTPSVEFLMAYGLENKRPEFVSMWNTEYYKQRIWDLCSDCSAGAQALFLKDPGEYYIKTLTNKKK